MKRRVSEFEVVLVHPEIPHNTGAVGRLCVGLGVRLHLIQPLGFSIDATEVKRAGLDYWRHVDLALHADWAAFLAQAGRGARLHVASTRAERSLYDVTFAAGDYLVFGSESRGLPADMYEIYRAQLVGIPMPGAHARSLNLANAVSVVAYEAFRQIGGPQGVAM